MAYRMQTSVPELTDLKNEPAETFALYGAEARKPGTFAANCLLARRLAERGVVSSSSTTAVGTSTTTFPRNPRAVPRRRPGPCRARADLKQRGLLDDTLVVWGGEFGRTTYSQGKLTATNFGRDHHGRCFTMWLAGGGIKPGMTHGETDDLWLQRRPRPGARPRPERHDPALLGDRSHAADLPVPGPRLSSDRRAWRGGKRYPRVS